MAPHTSWYPMDHPSDSMNHPPPEHQHRTDERPTTMPNMPFRLVAFTSDAPYPLHDTQPAEQSHMVDLISGDRLQRTGSIHQPVAEDFLNHRRELPTPPVKIYEEDQYLEVIEPIEEYAEDQDLPVIEPDEYLPEILPPSVGHGYNKANAQNESSVEVTPAKSKVDLLDAELAYVPPMSADEFSPALGGLHKLPTATSAPSKPSKRGRIKRFFSIKHRRQYGRSSW